MANDTNKKKDEMRTDQPKEKLTDLGVSGKTGQAAATKRASECDDPTTAGGLEGQYSDNERKDEDQWSPGSDLPTDQ
jgi:hypothetical protein